MDSIFKISKYGTYGISVEGLEKDNSEYLLETDVLVSTRNYAYSHTVTLNILKSVTATGVETLENSSVNLHTDLDISTFTINKDGLYLVSHIILPTEIWLAYVIERDASALDVYSNVYYYNKGRGKFYSYSAGVSTEVQLSEILGAAYIDQVLITDKVTTIIRTDKNTFINYYISDCLGGISKAILSRLPYKCDSNNEEFKDLLFKRDILWMATNVIKYNLDLQQLYEAQRILESISFCNGLCDPNVLSNTVSNCGCNS